MSDAFGYDALWSKSKVFIDRALQSRDDDDDLGYHLWSTVALELLGKAALSKIHPALVADPSQFKSLLAACGKQVTPALRSITASTLFERLTIAFHEFDDRLARECITLANRRNAELHSGESPMRGLDPRSWVPTLWRASAVLVAVQGRTLEEWLGAAEAARVQIVLEDSAETLTQTVIARIERRRKDFDSSHPKNSDKRRDAINRAKLRPLPRSISSEEAFEGARCPACGLDAWLFGLEYDRTVTDQRIEQHSEEDFTVFQTVTVYFSSDGFHCDECRLSLEGAQEIEIADLPIEFEREMEEEPDYGVDYGNE